MSVEVSCGLVLSTPAVCTGSSPAPDATAARTVPPATARGSTARLDMWQGSPSRQACACTQHQLAASCVFGKADRQASAGDSLLLVAASVGAHVG